MISGQTPDSKLQTAVHPHRGQVGIWMRSFRNGNPCFARERSDGKIRKRCKLFSHFDMTGAEDAAMRTAGKTPREKKSCSLYPPNLLFLGEDESRIPTFACSCCCFFCHIALLSFVFTVFNGRLGLFYRGESDSPTCLAKREEWRRIIFWGWM